MRGIRTMNQARGTSNGEAGPRLRARPYGPFGSVPSPPPSPRRAPAPQSPPRPTPSPRAAVRSRRPGTRGTRMKSRPLRPPLPRHHGKGAGPRPPQPPPARPSPAMSRAHWLWCRDVPPSRGNIASHWSAMNRAPSPSAIYFGRVLRLSYNGAPGGRRAAPALGRSRPAPPPLRLCPARLCPAGLPGPALPSSALPSSAPPPGSRAPGVVCGISTVTGLTGLGLPVGHRTESLNHQG